jgi:hypothetical protein
LVHSLGLAAVCGWNVVDIRGLILRVVRKDFQNFDVNLESQLEMILASLPCNFHISGVNTSTRFSAVLFFFLRGIQYANLVNLLMITQSWSQPSLKGRLVIKSMAIDFHGE